jgi:histidinol dehydrogenase
VDARRRGPAEIVGELRRPGGFHSQTVRDAARRIVDDVRERGDAALLEYTERFDGVRPQEIWVPQSEIDKGRESLSPELEESFGVAIANVRAFHEKEMDRSWERSHAGATTAQRRCRPR